MSKCSEIRDFCGDYAFEVEYSEDNKFTMFFNSHRNAQTVKRCIEVDDSVPNVATAVDFVEVVRCEDCKYWETIKTLYGEDNVCKRQGCMTVAKASNDFCSLGERIENGT